MPVMSKQISFCSMVTTKVPRDQPAHLGSLISAFVRSLDSIFTKCATCTCMRTFKSQTFLVYRGLSGHNHRGPVQLNIVYNMPSPIIY